MLSTVFGCLIFPLYIFHITAIGGSGSGVVGTMTVGQSDEEIYGIIVVVVTKEIREVILELFWSVKTALIEEFDQHYTVVAQATVVASITVVAIVGSHRGGVMECQEFSYMKPPKF